MARSCAICGKVSMGGFNPQSSGMNRVRAHRRYQPGLENSPSWYGAGRMQPIFLDGISVAFPELRIIGAHLGYGLYDSAEGLAQTGPNSQPTSFASDLVKNGGPGSPQVGVTGASSSSSGTSGTSTNTVTTITRTVNVSVSPAGLSSF